jgi:hypothetical protein
VQNSSNPASNNLTVITDKAKPRDNVAEQR